MVRRTLWIDLCPRLHGCLPAQCGSSRPTISAYQTVLIWCQEAGMETPVSPLFLLYSWQRGTGGTGSLCGLTALPPTTGTVERRPCWHNTLSPQCGRCFFLSPKNNLPSWRGGSARWHGVSASGGQWVRAHRGQELQLQSPLTITARIAHCGRHTFIEAPFRGWILMRVKSDLVEMLLNRVDLEVWWNNARGWKFI